MKNLGYNILVLILVVVFTLSACGVGGNVQTQDTPDLSCSEGVCVVFVIESPIALNQPVNVTVTINSTVDYPGLHLKLFSLPVRDIIFTQDSEWFYDATANQSHTFTSTVSFSSEGYYQLGVDVFIKGGFLIGDEERILITEGEVVINPTRDQNPTSELFNPVPPPVEALTMEAEPTHQPLPTIKEFSPQDWLELCGWDVNQPADLTEWADIHPVVEISSSVAMNSQVEANFTVGFKDIENPEAILTVRTGLCGWGEGWTTAAEYQWEVDLHSGIPFMATLDMQFTTSGEIPVYSVVLDEHNNRIFGEALWVTVKSSDHSSMNNMAALPQWRSVFTESFDSIDWPVGDSLWTVKDTTNESPLNLDRKWGFQNETLAVWPAAGGAAGLQFGTNYPNSYSSEMILGPIDLPDVELAAMNFSMLLDIEKGFDFLYLYISNNGYGWYEKGSWSDDNASWRDVSVDLYPGSTVYLRWKFVSDSSFNRSGVWVDDIDILVLPKTVTISGNVTYTGRDGTNGHPASYINIQTWEYDQDGSWDFLGEKNANEGGYFEFEPYENWDDDDIDGDHRLDLYLVYESVFNKYKNDEQIVTNVEDYSVYQWPIEGNYVRFNVRQNSFYITKALPESDDRYKAIWLFEDLMRSYQSVPGESSTGRIRWQQNTNCIDIAFGYNSCEPFFFPLIGPKGVFISDALEYAASQDTVVHEVAHHFMYNSNGFWYPFDGGLDDFRACVAVAHHYFDLTTDVCAFTEGWADFFAVSVNRTVDANDTCFDFDSGNCGGASQDIEEPDRNDNLNLGDTVEGRVASSLWDLFDAENEEYDHTTLDLASIWSIQKNMGSSFTFRDFWFSWVIKSLTDGLFNKHTAIQTFYQNSIDYDTRPVAHSIANIPTLQGLYRNNAVDLWDGAFSDFESTISEMSYSIVTPSLYCQASVSDNRYVDIDLRAYPVFTGLCKITVRASDGIKYIDNSFFVDVRQVVGRVFLPLAKKSSDSNQSLNVLNNGDTHLEIGAYLLMNAYPAPKVFGDVIEQSSNESKFVDKPYPPPEP